jgi:predicted solute-binding protein
MNIRLATTNDLDLAPFFFPVEAGWALAPAGLLEIVPGTVEEGCARLLDGEVDVALVGPAFYVSHHSQIKILPAPFYGSDINSNNIFLISKKRPDTHDKPRIALHGENSTGEVLLNILGRPFYGFEPIILPVDSHIEALDALSTPEIDMCLVSGEVGMRASGPASIKGYFVEDLTKAWWLLVGQPIPTGLFGVRQGWIDQNPDSSVKARQLMIFLRSSLQKSKEQLETLCEREEKRTGLPADALAKHFTTQRYEPTAAHLGGLLEFFRRASRLGLLTDLRDLSFFPPLGPLASAPPSPPRRTQPEKNRREEPARNNNARARAQAQGLQVIKGGKGDIAEDGENANETE